MVYNKTTTKPSSRPVTRPPLRGESTLAVQASVRPSSDSDETCAGSSKSKHHRPENNNNPKSTNGLNFTLNLIDCSNHVTTNNSISVSFSNTNALAQGPHHSVDHRPPQQGQQDAPSPAPHTSEHLSTKAKFILGCIAVLVTAGGSTAAGIVPYKRHSGHTPDPTITLTSTLSVSSTSSSTFGTSSFATSWVTVTWSLPTDDARLISPPPSPPSRPKADLDPGPTPSRLSPSNKSVEGLDADVNCSGGVEIWTIELQDDGLYSIDPEGPDKPVTVAAINGAITFVYHFAVDNSAGDLPCPVNITKGASFQLYGGTLNGTIESVTEVTDSCDGFATVGSYVECGYEVTGVA
ncbi:hypothetical protein HJFPF1_10282 [Paramyrothecium foliicola]|nr:hypothetical protein HJFPF1_10282 [Paramyrothecium foliicola]